MLMEQYFLQHRPNPTLGGERAIAKNIRNVLPLGRAFQLLTEQLLPLSLNKVQLRNVFASHISRTGWVVLNMYYITGKIYILHLTLLQFCYNAG